MQPRWLMALLVRICTSRPASRNSAMNRRRCGFSSGAPPVMSTTDAPARKAATSPATTRTDGIPKLLDLGSKPCIPCKMMAPILEEDGDVIAGLMRDFLNKHVTAR